MDGPLRRSAPQDEAFKRRSDPLYDVRRRASSASIEIELLQPFGPHPLTHDLIFEDNLLCLEDLLKRKPQLALAIANASDDQGRTAIQLAQPRCRKLLESYMSSSPFLHDLPATVRGDVYEAAIRLALKYANAGVEGKINGHILVLGDPDTLLCLGKQNKFDPFRDRRGDIRDTTDSEEVRRCMDADGMTVIDGRSGAPVANKFFSSGTSANITGGARSKSALWMAENAHAIVIKVSEDSKGEIIVHCGRGRDGEPMTLEYGSQKRATPKLVSCCSSGVFRALHSGSEAVCCGVFVFRYQPRPNVDGRESNKESRAPQRVASDPPMASPMF